MEFAVDVAKVIISYTPIVGVVDTIKFGEKWISKKRIHTRIARYMQESDRRNFIKARGRKIRASYARWDGAY